MAHELTEAFNELSNMPCEISCFEQLFHCWHYSRCEVDEVIPNEANLILHSLNQRINKQLILENSLAVRKSFRSLEVALKEYDLKEVQ